MVTGGGGQRGQQQRRIHRPVEPRPPARIGPRGIDPDAAAVNVNFWITPDEANLNPAGGGLVVWDKEAPKEWDFKAYNSDKNRGRIYEWLTQQGAREIKIPYRANRAVLFNSDLFHETDDIAFKEGLTNRRINITLQYGHRHRSSAGLQILRRRQDG